MSRIGRNPVVVPDAVDIRIDGQTVTVKGPLGALSAVLVEDVRVALDEGAIVVRPRDDSRRARSMWGTSRSVLNNMVKGVSEGFVKRLEINGVGYRAAVSGSTLTMLLGYSHDIVYPIPDGIEIKCERPTLIEVSGTDRQRVGQVAAEIRAFRKPEPYKGKGIKYEGEYIFRKEGKKK